VIGLKDQFKLGVVQMTVSEDKSVSVDKAVRNIQMLGEKGADVIVLPEMFNCPYETDRFQDYAEEEGGETWQALQGAAKENGVYVIGGTIPEREGTHLYNTCFIFDPQGNQIGKHRKVHLFDIDVENGQYFRESDTLTPGDEVTVIETAFGKIGIAVCYDVRFPELARLMAERGARMLVYPAAFNMTTGPVHWEILFRSRALDNLVYTVGCAPARDYSAAYISYGNSIVVNPWGEVVGRLDGEESYLMGAIDLGDVARMRKQIPVLDQLRRDLYAVGDVVSSAGRSKSGAAEASENSEASKMSTPGESE
jgi:predicted amidohydrolase